MLPGLRCCISRSALASFILDVARTWAEEIADLTLEFVEAPPGRPNWRVASVDPGPGDAEAAGDIVAMVVRGNAHWMMVEDDSGLEGRIVW